MEPKHFTCRIDLNIWCDDDKILDKVYKACIPDGIILQLDKEDWHTKIDSPIVHKMLDEDVYSLDIEGTLIEPPVGRTVRNIMAALQKCGRIWGIILYYKDPDNRQCGYWRMDNSGFYCKYLPEDYWPAEIDCGQCRLETDGLSGQKADAEFCSNCLDILDASLEKHGDRFVLDLSDRERKELKTVPEPKKKELKTMSKDNTEYPNLTCSEEDMKKLYDVIESIGLLDTDMIIKAGDAPMFLNAACTLCNCAFAIFDGDSGDDLQKLEELSNSLHEFNRVAGDYKEAIADVEASLV